MKKCPYCNISYPEDISFCPTDGIELVGINPSRTNVSMLKMLEKQYKIERTLERNSFTTVYQGQELATGQKIIITVLPSSIFKTQIEKESFQRRMTLLQRKLHPGIAKVYQFGVIDDDSFYVVTECIEGKSLKKLLLNIGSLSIPLSLSIVQQILMVLEFLHHNDILLFNLTPSKVFLVESPGNAFVKLQIVDPYVSGESLGNTDYLAPELVNRDDPTVQCDVYSVGVIWYEMLAGTVPFPQGAFSMFPETEWERLVSMENTKPSLKISPKMQRVISQSIKWDVQHRFPNATVFLKAVQKIRRRKIALKPLLVAILLLSIVYLIPKKFDLHIEDWFKNWNPPHKIRSVPNKYADQYLIQKEKTLSQYELELKRLREKPQQDSGDLYLFTLDSKYGDCLSRCEISAELQTAFASNRAKISFRAMVYEKKHDESWLVRDKTWEYLIKKVQTSYRVYEHQMREIKGGQVAIRQGNVQQILEIPPFYIDCTEVTNAQYQKFVKDITHRSPSYWTGTQYPENQGNYPVVEVTWYDAKLYAIWCGKDLPSEAQWEIAANGGDRTVQWPWGDIFQPELERNANVASNVVLPVGYFRDQWKENWRTPGGLVDMTGNVWEWTDSWYDSPLEQDKVIKGGSFVSVPDQTQISYRDGFFPSASRRDIGFRCVKPKK